ncbi:hypothetical protein Ancab_037714 [Ancistrocladus abbreviatus]
MPRIFSSLLLNKARDHHGKNNDSKANANPLELSGALWGFSLGDLDEEEDELVVEEDEGGGADDVKVRHASGREVEAREDRGVHGSTLLNEEGHHLDEDDTGWDRAL